VNLITLDFETYYDKEFSLSKITTEEYIRSDKFEVIGLAVKVNDGETEWASGSREELREWLRQFDFKNSVTLAHNAMFDGAILNWHFGIRPFFWLDTLCMARALHGVEVSGSLAKLVEAYELGAKGTEVVNALGKHRADFSDEELSRYGDYCINDVELTYKLYNIMQQKRAFPKKELHLINLTLKMFIEPVLHLDKRLLGEHLRNVLARKEELLTQIDTDTVTLMSNPKFAAMLETYGVKPPMKISLTTGKETLALAKGDEGFKALAEHPDVRVQALVAARLGMKSTLEETRTHRFIGIADRGALPVPIKYYAAHTGRFGGDDKVNLQNLPSRGNDANKLKKAIIAPEGYTIIEADSAQIEARVLAWFAGQQDLIDAFANKKDVYKKMASAIYGKPEEEITKEERFVGKTTILGCGYGMGAAKFQAQLKTMGVELDIDESRRIVRVYRETNQDVVRLWAQAHTALAKIVNNEPWDIGREGVVEIMHRFNAIQLPNKLLMYYTDLSFTEGEKGPEYTYKTRQGRTKIYGGKVIENLCQALARCIIAEQMLHISQKVRVVLTVHDSIVCVVKDAHAAVAQEFIEEMMRTAPRWAQGLPLDCESGMGKSYGDC